MGVSAIAANRMIGINVLLKTDITPVFLAALGQYGKVRDVVTEIKAVTLQAPESALPAIQKLPFVVAANPDAERPGAPVDTVEVTNFANGISTWDMNAINVTNFSQGLTICLRRELRLCGYPGHRPVGFLAAVFSPRTDRHDSCKVIWRGRW